MRFVKFELGAIDRFTGFVLTYGDQVYTTTESFDADKIVRMCPKTDAKSGKEIVVIKMLGGEYIVAMATEAEILEAIAKAVII